MQLKTINEIDAIKLKPNQIDDFIEHGATSNVILKIGDFKLLITSKYIFDFNADVFCGYQYKLYKLSTANCSNIISIDLDDKIFKDFEYNNIRCYHVIQKPQLYAIIRWLQAVTKLMCFL